MTSSTSLGEISFLFNNQAVPAAKYGELCLYQDKCVNPIDVPANTNASTFWCLIK